MPFLALRVVCCAAMVRGVKSAGRVIAACRGSASIDGGAGGGASTPSSAGGAALSPDRAVFVATGVAVGGDGCM